MAKLIFLDFEVFAYEWFICITEVWKENNIINKKDIYIYNSRDELLKYYNANKDKGIFIGKNIARYDMGIFLGILENINAKTLNDKIIVEDMNWKFIVKNWQNYKFLYIDTMQDAEKMSLKEEEGYYGLPIVNTEVSFTLDRKLTKKELEDETKYCRADVDALMVSFERMSKSILTKLKLIYMYKLPINCISYSNAGLVDKLLEATSCAYTDEFNRFKFSSIPVVPVAQSVVNFYNQRLDYSNSLTTYLAGVEHTFGIGGLHGAIPNFSYEGEIWLWDVASLYPSIMIYYNFFSRNISLKNKLKLIRIYFDRLKNKAENNEQLKLVLEKERKFYAKHPQYGEYNQTIDLTKEHKPDTDLATIGKLVLNTVYGTFKDVNKSLYDPRMANNICIAGQLIITNLIERLTPYIKLIQLTKMFG